MPSLQALFSADWQLSNLNEPRDGPWCTPQRQPFERDPQQDGRQLLVEHAVNESNARL
jgi:hypothetical protein